MSPWYCFSDSSFSWNFRVRLNDSVTEQLTPIFLWWIAFQRLISCTLHSFAMNKISTASESHDWQISIHTHFTFSSKAMHRSKGVGHDNRKCTCSLQQPCLITHCTLPSSFVYSQISFQEATVNILHVQSCICTGFCNYQVFVGHQHNILCVYKKRWCQINSSANYWHVVFRSILQQRKPFMRRCHQIAQHIWLTHMCIDTRWFNIIP